MATLDPKDEGKKSDLQEYEDKLEKVMAAARSLPMASNFAFITRCKEIDGFGLNPKTNRHEMTDLDVKHLKLMIKEMMLQKMQQDKMFAQIMKAEGIGQPQ